MVTIRLLALLAFASAAALAGAQPPALRYQAGDRYELGVYGLSVAEFKESAAHQPPRVIRTWEVRAILTLREKEGALAVTAGDVEVKGSWDAKPAPAGFGRVQRRFYDAFELVLPREPDGSIRRPPGIENLGDKEAAIAECLVPTVPDRPVVPGDVWAIPYPPAPRKRVRLIGPRAGRGLYERDVEFKKVVKGWFPRDPRKPNLAQFTYTVTGPTSCENLVVYLWRPQGTLVKSILRRWSRPAFLPGSVKEQLQLQSYTVRRLPNR